MADVPAESERRWYSGSRVSGGGHASTFGVPSTDEDRAALDAALARKRPLGFAPPAPRSTPPEALCIDWTELG
jgi:hypothetical protein